MIGGVPRDRARKEVLVEYGFRLPSAPTTGRHLEEWRLRSGSLLRARRRGPTSSTGVVEQVVRPTGLFVDPQVTIRGPGQVDDLEILDAGERVLSYDAHQGWPRS
ncbi:MAG: hypothetical protein U0166_14685 [Acidobacteriota bacterium]